MQLAEIERKVTKLEARKSLLEEESARMGLELSVLSARGLTSRKSSLLLQHCSAKTRQSLVSSLEDTVSWAVQIILDKPYKFKIEFVQRRNQWEADMFLLDEQDQKIDIINGSGGGLVDVISITLFLIFHSLFGAQSKVPLILDEVLKNLSTEIPDIAERTVLFLKGISERLGVQIIMITHQEPLLPAADKAFRVEIKNGKSEIEVLPQSKTFYE